jgi:uncharacterized membrane protein YeaQ/YmgE (transglycosylase-associated protein family)
MIKSKKIISAYLILAFMYFGCSQKSFITPNDNLLENHIRNIHRWSLKHDAIILTDNEQSFIAKNIELKNDTVFFQITDISERSEWYRNNDWYTRHKLQEYHFPITEIKYIRFDDSFHGFQMGFIWGMIFGGMSGCFIGDYVYNHHGYDEDPDPQGAYQLMYSVLGATICGFFGGTIGSSIKIKKYFYFDYNTNDKNEVIKDY